jgi:hypothetical protein
MNISIGMTRVGFRKLAEDILRQLNESPAPGIEVRIEAEHNGYGSRRTFVLNNDDMQGDHIPNPDVVYWEEV